MLIQAYGHLLVGLIVSNHILPERHQSDRPGNEWGAGGITSHHTLDQPATR